MISKDWEGSNFYQDLGVSPDASFAEIKSAYRKALRAYHPDFNSQADQSERFQAVTKAYSVLKDAKSRDLYDEYLFGNTELPRRNAEEGKENKKRNLLFRAALFVLVLLLLNNLGLIGVQQQSGQNNSQTNTGGGTSQGGAVNTGDSNQVLALMVGPVGPPGPVGIAGKDGFVGLNGYQGKDGIAGAPGAVGEQGPIGPAGEQGIQGLQGLQGQQGLQGLQGIQGVEGAGVAIVVLEPGDDDNCAAGGTKFVSSTNLVSYACNGTGGSGGSGSLGSGYVAVGTCDSSVKVSLETAYTGDQFKMSAIIIDELAGACNGKTLTAVLKIKSGSISASGSPGYEAGQSYQCTTILDLAPSSAANSVALTSADCTNTFTNELTFNNIWALDVSSASDGLLLQII